jgi:hypothetical protein
MSYRKDPGTDALLFIGFCLFMVYGVLDYYYHITAFLMAILIVSSITIGTISEYISDRRSKKLHEDSVPVVSEDTSILC